MHVLLIKILMTFNISLSCTKKKIDIIAISETRITKQVSLLNNLNLNNYSFIEIVNPKKSNILVGVIYRHPSMDLPDFNCNYLNKLLENISKEQKSIFLLGDVNVNLLNYDEHDQTNEFLDSLASNSFIPLILQPTRITSHFNTLIDNIFSNVIDPDTISLMKKLTDV